jgi:hypothetical protein
MSEKVNHPNHYNALPIECIDVIEHFDFCIGSAIKYLWRAGLKDGEADLDDYKKAIWYIQRKIEMLEKQRAVATLKVETVVATPASNKQTDTYQHTLQCSCVDEYITYYGYIARV